MQFHYQVKNQSGEVLEGMIEAPTEVIAVDTLHGRGYVVISLQSTKKDVFSTDLDQFFSKPNNKDIVIFTRQLSTLIDAEMPLSEGLRTLAKQTEKSVFRKILDDISDSVEGGTSLSVAMGNYPKLFTPFYVKLVYTGEVAGKLHETLNYLADYLERNFALSGKLRGALAYPLFIVFAMICVTTVMMVYVLPELLLVFKESGSAASLPLPTRMLIAVTDFFNAYFKYILIGGVGGIILFVRYVRTPQGEAWFDDIKLRLPLFGKVLRTTYIARMTETFTTLIRSGIAILESIKIVSDLVGNKVYQQILIEAQENVKAGGTISSAFENRPEIPALATSMIAIGEKTGKLDSMMAYIAKFYRTESENSIQSISQLIEPALMLVLGVGVAVLVSAILLPMYTVVSQ